MEKLLVLQDYRYRFPSRLNRWDYIYAYTLLELQNRKSNCEETNKKFTTLRNKLISRLNKVNEMNEKELKKD